MDFPVELEFDKNERQLVLQVSSLKPIGEKLVIVPQDKIQRLGFFSLTSEYVYSASFTIQQIESELQRLGIDNVNAYRVIRKKRFTLDKPYREMETTTFQSYRIPEDLAQRERRNIIELARACTS